MIQYVFYSRCREVSERFVKLNKSGTGDKAEFEKASQGWYASFDGSHEAMYVGDEAPEFKKGDIVKITIQKVADVEVKANAKP